MALQEFSLEPRNVAKVETPYRIIKTRIPVPESVFFLKKLWSSEPRSMHCEPPIIGGDAKKLSGTVTVLGADGLAATKMAAAVHESLESGKVINL